ncbi:MAG: deoxyribodipyrimidine photo-lyase [Ignavibacteria bacterium]|nr:deoxyribodipyrimidine photo-lyase [Ignavibacteria bacterium]
MTPALFGRSIAWFRRDLRLSDHAALARACASSSQVVPVFVFDRTILDALEDRDDRRVTFIARSLAELDDACRARGSQLVVLHGDPAVEIPRFARDVGAEAVFANRDYEPAAKRRDDAVRRSLEATGIRAFFDKDQVIFEGRDILTAAETPYRVFTPYKRAWLARFMQERLTANDPAAARTPDLRALAPASVSRRFATPWTLDAIGFRASPLWLHPGEAAATYRLKEFLKRVDLYDEDRDTPSVEGTSGLSAHLRFGTISIRALVREAAKRHADMASEGKASAGATVWMSELIWREFYQMILDQFPHVATGAFKPACDRIVWPGDLRHFDAWREGRTGYPLVDAAMRHFAATGWMHNRLRMVAAMFLVKDLLLDWRLGEAHFARGLLDFDLAANNGGWQWCASTGCDAQPYFRVFNPILQSRKFDPLGATIRTHCPELRGFSDARIHWPHEASPSEQAAAGCRIGEDYPHPVVVHAAQKERAVALFKALGADA